MKQIMIAVSLTAALSIATSVAVAQRPTIGPALDKPTIVGINVPAGGFIIETNGYAERPGNTPNLSEVAWIYVTVTDKEGNPITDLGPTKSYDGSNKPKVPPYWVVRNLSKSNICVLQPIGFKNYAEAPGLENAPGAYRITVRLTSPENAYCAWDSEDRYAYVVQLRRIFDVVGMGLGELMIEH